MPEARNAKVITYKQALSVICPECWARPKIPCFSIRGSIATCELVHPGRTRAAQELIARPLLGELNATDKALLLYYAYTMLCDSVSTKAVEILGHEFDSEQIQAFFAAKAMKELQADGLIPVPEKVHLV